MEATVIKIDDSLGVKVPKSIVEDFNLTAGSIVELNFRHNGELVLRRKSKNREGWDAIFAQYALDGEDKQLLPDFFDSETDNLL
jgi:antitoxin component of MazEF toxin-antitoxin module